MTTAEQRKDLEINIFARWFGNMLVELKRHDLRLKKRATDPRPYAHPRDRESVVDFISYSR